MNWQQLWLGFLFPMTVSGRALGPTEEAAMDYLLQYGYLQKPLEGPHHFRPEDITEALRAFQEATELPISGQLDDATRARMRQPRCGLEDPFNQKTLKYLLLGRWRKKHLTFRILNLPSTLSPHTARASLLQAFKYWSNVVPLTFREVKAGWADIRLSFHGRQSTYCSNTFDGPGKVLAHADIPELGSVHFDEDELWSEGTYWGVNLRIIAAHELGHALGLGHSRYTQALMAPVYAGYRPYFKLHPDDVAGIQALYGKKRPRDEEEDMEVPTVPPVPTEPGPMPNPCSGELDAMMMGPRGKTYAFKGNYVWTVTDSGRGPMFQVSALWEGLPGNLDAAVYSPRTQWIHFFKGDKVWRYINFKMSPGFPKKLNRVEPNLDAAFYWPFNQKIFLFKGSGYWQWDELVRNDFSRYPKPIKELFSGVPDQPSAAMSWRDGQVYFFKGKKYWRLNQQLLVEKGYPRNTAHNWMHCHPQTLGTTRSTGDNTSSATGITLNTTSSTMETTLNLDHSPTDTILDIMTSAINSTTLSLPANVPFQRPKI
ncbi:matrix metallopeptidase 19 [Ictidomys tridecemlineatus]|uniref:Matrix metalloproteinase-19 n=2 Tax=Ictidomys tridecemlineatus TaxID=43179 RepID=I3LWB4_ICTTR|nr:matrix metalloproteinase-19 isoform X1 [Ictidomys tridecemlineatus]KAG3291669.1 matrix metallopeptidase 19 [Ictidomys tridecemlineatus]